MDIEIDETGDPNNLVLETPVISWASLDARKASSFPGKKSFLENPVIVDIVKNHFFWR